MNFRNLSILEAINEHLSDLYYDWDFRDKIKKNDNSVTNEQIDNVVSFVKNLVDIEIKRQKMVVHPKQEL